MNTMGSDSLADVLKSGVQLRAKATKVKVKSDDHKSRAVFGLCYWYVDVETLYNLNRVCRAAWEAYRALDINKFSASFTCPRDRLRVFANYYAGLPAPGTDEWLRTRSYVGGSEISTWLGLNPYQTADDLLYDKFYKNRGAGFKGNEFTVWGNWFEPVLFQVASDKLGAKLLELGSIPGFCADGEIVQSYTPDRIGVVSRNKLAWSNSQFSSDPSDVIVLFEGKCPFSRVPDGRVPAHYVPQPLLGACTIPIVEACAFVDGMFRRCKREEFHFNVLYDQELHGEFKCTRAPIAIGCLLFGSERAVDLGSDTNALKRLIRKSIDNRFTPEYKYITKGQADPKEWLDSMFAQNCAVLPWKLFKLHIIDVPIQPDFLQKNIPLLLSARERIKSYVDPAIFDPEDL